MSQPVNAADELPAGPVYRPVRPLFAAAVARRKWEELQDAGHRMQRIYFEREDGSAGHIDAWGVVTWTRPTGWTCVKCGTDRTKAACPKGHSAALTGECPMVGAAA